MKTGQKGTTRNPSPVEPPFGPTLLDVFNERELKMMTPEQIRAVFHVIVQQADLRLLRVLHTLTSAARAEYVLGRQDKEPWT